MADDVLEKIRRQIRDAKQDLTRPVAEWPNPTIKIADGLIQQDNYVEPKRLAEQINA